MKSEWDMESDGLKRKIGPDGDLQEHDSERVVHVRWMVLKNEKLKRP